MRQFWQQKKLHELTDDEWERLCDGCGQCCLLKLIDDDTGEQYHTRIACKLLNIGRCRCTDYGNRHRRVPDCIAIDADNIPKLDWLPETCAYRLIGEGKDLYWWHPLVSGTSETVHQAGASIRAWAISEEKLDEPSYYRYVIKRPEGAKKKK